MDRDTSMRQAAFAHVRDLMELRESLTAGDLAPGFQFEGVRIPLINPVSPQLLDQNDGPMLEGLKKLQGMSVHLPRRAKDYPDRDRLPVPGSLRYPTPTQRSQLSRMLALIFWSAILEWPVQTGTSSFARYARPA